MGCALAEVRLRQARKHHAPRRAPPMVRTHRGDGAGCPSHVRLTRARGTPRHPRPGLPWRARGPGTLRSPPIAPSRGRPCRTQSPRTSSLGASLRRMGGGGASLLRRNAPAMRRANASRGKAKNARTPRREADMGAGALPLAAQPLPRRSPERAHRPRRKRTRNPLSACTSHGAAIVHRAHAEVEFHLDFHGVHLEARFGANPRPVLAVEVAVHERR